MGGDFEHLSPHHHPAYPFPILLESDAVYLVLGCAFQGVSYGADSGERVGCVVG